MADIVAKKDIEVLTKQVLNEKSDILECLKREHIQIDSSLLSEQFSPKFEQELYKITKLCSKYTDDEHNVISLDDIEDVVRSFERLDKNLHEPKTPAANNIGIIGSRKDINGSKRFGSMTDINKTLLRSLSSQNLNSTKLFIEPQGPAPRSGVNCNVTLVPKTTNEKPFSLPKLSFKQICDHNMRNEDIKISLDSFQHHPNRLYATLLRDISRKYKIAFDRLNTFFIEIQQIQSKSAESENDVLEDLDESLLNSMSKLSEALTQVRFIAENNNLYNSGNIKEINSLLSDDLTDILDHFYRTMHR